GSALRRISGSGREEAVVRRAGVDRPPGLAVDQCIEADCLRCVLALDPEGRRADRQQRLFPAAGAGQQQTVTTQNDSEVALPGVVRAVVAGVGAPFLGWLGRRPLAPRSVPAA